MKKFWEKHSLGKILSIVLVLAVILSWVIPVGSFNGSEFVDQGLLRIGIADFGNMLYYVIAMAIDKVLFLLALGAFYGILTKVPAYQRIVTTIAKKLKGKEILFTVLVSLFLTVFTAFSSSAYASLIFVPFVINILASMKLDKMTVLVSTFGSILIGTLGTIFGTEGLYWLNYYLANNAAVDFMKDGVIYRVVILVVGILLFNFFTITHMKKSLKNKNNEIIEDVYEVNEVKDKVRTWPMIVVLSIVALFTILGFIRWNESFGIEIFDNFHTWLTELTIGKDQTIFAYILGNSGAALGSSDFSLFTMISVLFFLGLIVAIMSRLDFGKILSSVSEGIKKIGKPVLALSVAYTIFTVFYLSPMMNTIVNTLMPVDGKPNINIDYNGSGIAYFNIDSDDDGKADKNLVNTKDNCKVNCDTNNDGYPDKNLDFDGNGKVDENDEEILDSFTEQSITNLDIDGDGLPDVNVDTDFSIAGATIASIVSSIFHLDLNYTAYSLSSYMVTGFGANLSILFIIFLTMYGFAQFVVPTSAILIIGLTYSNVEYKNWLKYIWKFLVGMFVCLLVIYLLMFYL
ncbi:MAG: hypothetical protein IJA94_01950 [Bacilli bacterium]|nr:hypothetical protein [Bacilli bacterium]